METFCDVTNAIVLPNPYGHVVILDEITTKVALERKPEWNMHVRNGKMKVKLVRNQYGTKEAGRLWHDLISRSFFWMRVTPRMCWNHATTTNYFRYASCVFPVPLIALSLLLNNSRGSFIHPVLLL